MRISKLLDPCGFNFTLLLTQISRHAVLTRSQFYVFLYNNDTSYLLQLVRPLHSEVEWSPWYESLCRLSRNICRSYQDAICQIIAYFYFCNINIFFDAAPWRRGARGSVVDWGSMLQAGRSRGVPMRWIFSIYLIHPVALWLWGLLSL
jgi:hypothetical protein